MKLQRLLKTMEVPLTTTAAPVVAPQNISGTSTLLVGAQSGDMPVYWRRQALGGAGVSKLCPDNDLVLPMQITPGQTLFYAKTVSGTGSLEIEFWE